VSSTSLIVVHSGRVLRLRFGAVQLAQVDTVEEPVHSRVADRAVSRSTPTSNPVLSRPPTPPGRRGCFETTSRRARSPARTHHSSQRSSYPARRPARIWGSSGVPSPCGRLPMLCPRSNRSRRSTPIRQMGERCARSVERGRILARPSSLTTTNAPASTTNGSNDQCRIKRLTPCGSRGARHRRRDRSSAGPAGSIAVEMSTGGRHGDHVTQLSWPATSAIPCPHELSCEAGRYAVPSCL